MKNSVISICIATLTIASLLLALSPPTDKLAAGQQAPEFSLPDQTGEMHSLSDYLGQKVLVYFYPKDDTPGDTKEACGLRDSYATYESAGIVILGISFDNAEAHQKFIAKHALPFTLLSDLDQSVAKTYGAKGPYPLPLRKSFLIDKTGAIVKIISKVDVTTHSEDVLRYFVEG